MTFSLRALMAVTPLIACGVFLQRNLQRERRLRQTLASKYLVIDQVETSIGLKFPGYRQALVDEMKQQPGLIRLQDQACDHYQKIMSRQVSIEPRGTNVFSIRMLSRLPREAGLRPIMYHLFVPEHRQVWLKMGIKDLVNPVCETNNPANLDGEVPFMESTSNRLLGPFEMQLTGGNHQLVLDVHHRGSQPTKVAIRWDEQSILETGYVAEGSAEATLLSMSPNKQADVNPTDTLPWLAARTFTARDDGNEMISRKQITFWLSDQSSGFESFPNTTNSIASNSDLEFGVP